MFQAQNLIRCAILALASTTLTNLAQAAPQKTAAVVAAPVPAPAPAPVASTVDMSKPATITEIIKTEIKTGAGAEAVAGKIITVHYSAWLYSIRNPDHKSALIESSVERAPFTFTLGAGKVLKGWDQGLPGMKVGGKRNLIVPSALAYGERGAGRGAIPRNAVMVFEFELLDVKDAEATAPAK